MGLVSQEPILFATTIGANIAYGKPGATPAEIEAAAIAANAHSFISALPHGCVCTLALPLWAPCSSHTLINALSKSPLPVLWLQSLHRCLYRVTREHSS